jgi:hypothetical protein
VKPPEVWIASPRATKSALPISFLSGFRSSLGRAGSMPSSRWMPGRTSRSSPGGWATAAPPVSRVAAKKKQVAFLNFMVFHSPSPHSVFRTTAHHRQGIRGVAGKPARGRKSHVPLWIAGRFSCTTEVSTPANLGKVTVTSVIAAITWVPAVIPSIGGVGRKCGRLSPR